MLRIPAAISASISFVLAALNNVSLESLKSTVVDLVILGRVPLSNWQISFDPIFLIICVTVCLILLGYALGQLRRGFEQIIQIPENLTRHPYLEQSLRRR